MDQTTLKVSIKNNDNFVAVVKDSHQYQTAGSPRSKKTNISANQIVLEKD